MNKSRIDPQTEQVLNDLRRWRAARTTDQILADLRRDMQTNPVLRAVVIFAGEELTRDVDDENTKIEPY